MSIEHFDSKTCDNNKLVPLEERDISAMTYFKYVRKCSIFFLKHASNKSICRELVKEQSRQGYYFVRRNYNLSCTWNGYTVEQTVDGVVAALPAAVAAQLRTSPQYLQ